MSKEGSPKGLVETIFGLLDSIKSDPADIQKASDEYAKGYKRSLKESQGPGKVINNQVKKEE